MIEDKRCWLKVTVKLILLELENLPFWICKQTLLAPYSIHRWIRSKEHMWCSKANFNDGDCITRHSQLFPLMEINLQLLKNPMRASNSRWPAMVSLQQYSSATTTPASWSVYINQARFSIPDRKAYSRLEKHIEVHHKFMNQHIGDSAFFLVHAELKIESSDNSWQYLYWTSKNYTMILTTWIHAWPNNQQAFWVSRTQFSRTMTEF